MTGTAQAFDIVFLITGKPLPAMLDLAYHAQASGQRTLMILLERGQDDLVIDEALVNFTISTIRVPYRGVDVKRVFSIPVLFWRIRREVVRSLRPDGVVVTGAYDLLAMAWLFSVGRRYRLRHQVRDLHRLQLSGSFPSRVLVQVERMMLRRVDRLLVSSPAFSTGYYGRIYRGCTILLENTPAESTWQGYTRIPRAGGVFRVGFIGIIRYRRSLAQLIEAVQRLAAARLRIQVIFAGGGTMPADLAERIRSTPELFAMSGPYQYTRDIKRLYSEIDLIYAVYDGDDGNCQLAMPNKFYEAIIAKIPILVADGTFVGDEVRRAGIGATVRTGDADALEALLREAVAGQGWYEQAADRLARTEARPYFDAYRRALADSVAP